MEYKPTQMPDVIIEYLSRNTDKHVNLVELRNGLIESNLCSEYYPYLLLSENIKKAIEQDNNLTYDDDDKLYYDCENTNLINDVFDDDNKNDNKNDDKNDNKIKNDNVDDVDDDDVDDDDDENDNEQNVPKMTKREMNDLMDDLFETIYVNKKYEDYDDVNFTENIGGNTVLHYICMEGRYDLLNGIQNYYPDEFDINVKNTEGEQLWHVVPFTKNGFTTMKSIINTLNDNCNEYKKDVIIYKSFICAILFLNFFLMMFKFFLY